MRNRIIVVLSMFVSASFAFAEQPPTIDTSRGDKMIAEYFRVETDRLREACLSEIQTAEDCQQHSRGRRSCWEERRWWPELWLRW